MIKKVKITNYGPFKNAEINLENNSMPVHIIGMNDVGKTVLLNAIKAGTFGINKKYELNKLDPSISLTFLLSQDNYDKEIVAELKKEGIEPFIGEFSINITKNEKDINTNVLISNKYIKNYVEKFLEIINKYLSSQQNIKIDQLIDEELDKRIIFLDLKNIKKEIDTKANILIKLFMKWKNIVYDIAFNSVSILEADSNDYFSFLKPSYTLNDTTNDEGEIIKSGWKDIKKFLKSFLSNEDINKFKNNIFSDTQYLEKRKYLKTFEEKINNEMGTFFEKNFPSQNNDLKFSFECHENNIVINIKDSIIDNYISLNKRSDGFKWFLKIFMLLRNIKNYSIILIDEPEKFLHASAQKELVKIFERIKLQKNIQIIYVTHSPFLLTKNIFSSLKIIVKDKEQSKIFNNINDFINSNVKNIKDAMLPIVLSLGINLFELHKLNNINGYLFVEGEADLYTINIAKHLSNQDQKAKWKYFICPMMGSKNLYGIGVIKMFKFQFKIMLDGSKEESKNHEFGKNEICFITDLCKNKNIINPEDMLSNSTKKKYKIDQIKKMNTENKKITNHKIGWQKLHDDVVVGKYKLSDDEINKLKIFFDNLLLFLK